MSARGGPVGYQLSFTLSWMPTKNRTNDDHLRFFKSFFTNYAKLSEPPRLEDDVRKRPSPNFYQEDIYQVDCIVPHQTIITWFEPDTKYAEIGRLWCEAGRSRQYAGLLQWLTPHPGEGFWRGTNPQDRGASVASLSFGTLIGLTSFVEHQCISANCRNSPYDIDCVFQHDERLLCVYIELNHIEACSEHTTLYRFVVPYQNVIKVLIRDTDKQHPTDIYLHLKCPPMLYGKKVPREEEPDDLGKSLLGKGESLAWERVLGLGCRCVGNTISARSLGGCLVLKLSVQDKSRARRILGRLSQRCAMATEFHYCPVRTQRINPDLLREVTDKHTSFIQRLHYSCAYASNAVFTQSFDIPDQMALLRQTQQRELFHLLLKLAYDDPSAFEKTFFCISSSLECGNVILIRNAISRVYQKYRNHPENEDPPPGTCMVRRVFLTPSRVLYLPAQVHCENRILREFNPEYAIRVSFRDDNLDKLSHTLQFHSQKDEFLNAVVGNVLRNGVKISFREFHFLAASCSQLRDHGIWMYAEDDRNNTATSIRKWMGEFDGIRNVAKKMARMGQCFSSTEETVKIPLKSKMVENVPDILRGKHPVSGEPYVFSDGIGMISPSLLGKVLKSLHSRERPSAVQIRYAGYKGMICVNPELTDDKLILRESMLKFPCSNSESLETIKSSAPRPVFLNRPLITILEQLGVPSHIFLRLQEHMILEFTDALVYEELAVELLTTWVKNSLIPFRALWEGGLSLTQDPFFRSLLLAIYRNAVSGLRYKSRIAIPANEGRNMLGVLDETDTLEYGEIYVQYTELGSGTHLGTKVLTGTVLVTKCPCLHPGDVRKFTAVDVPALSHINDCIVFPAKGKRPHPDEMAGSDLDGDEYVVIWDPKLFFPGPNHEPMDFPDKGNGKVYQGSIKVEHMIRFLCNYIKNDSIGLLSNAHLAWADQEEEGIFSKKCCQIAEKIPLCLDFAKTGQTAFLKRDEKPRMYPDFMEKGGNKNTYRSNRVLGHLYRACRSLESAVSHMGFHSDGPRYCPLLEYPGWQRYEEEAKEALQLYNARLKRILNQYCIESEGEIMSGVINSYGRYNQDKSEKTNVEVLVEKQSQFLSEKTRQSFFRGLEEEFKKRGVTLSQSKVVMKYQKASAWYMVTYDRDDRQYVSFPWCLADVLSEIISRPLCKNYELFKCKNTLAYKMDQVTEEKLKERNFTDIGFDIIRQWAAKEELLIRNTGAGAAICEDCLLQEFMNFVYISADLSINNSTVGNLVLNFLRHCTNYVDLPKGRCLNDACSSGHPGHKQTHRLPMAALRTYSMIALSRDLCHLGLPCTPSLHEPYQEVTEGDPVRIPVNNESFKRALTMNVDEVKKLLAKWSGVQHVHIRGQQDLDDRWYLLVSATGRDWQRWFLEELLLQPWLPDAIEMKSIVPFIKS
ncbi:uncharacterized protein LOC135390766 isoform X2 [Ornithodoros turicata]|uniref:uncharacterized protein LOC135390766 isoform X2 n=1 Tax=Ornithodoros turicata TaxID=34597 RepID=UPI00313872D5